MRYILVASGEDNFKQCYEKQNGDCVWAIDGGLKTLEKEGIIPDVFIGDNDSALSNDIISKQTILLNPCKDYSDLEEALMTDNIDSVDDDIVTEVLLKGYKLKDRVIRPASVKINKKD